MRRDYDDKIDEYLDKENPFDNSDNSDLGIDFDGQVPSHLVLDKAEETETAKAIIAAILNGPARNLAQARGAICSRSRE